MIALDELVTRATAAEYALIMATCNAVRADVLQQLTNEYHKMFCDVLRKEQCSHGVDQRIVDALRTGLEQIKEKFET